MNKPATRPAVIGIPQPATPHGRWLLVARVSWIVLTLLVLVANVVMLPRFYAQLLSPCQPGPLCFSIQLTSHDVSLLHQLGLSLNFLAIYQIVLNIFSILICCGLAALIFLRRSADRMALFCAFMLVLFGVVALTSILQDTLAPISPAWYALYSILDILGQSSFIIFFFLFPSGRFVPRWTRWIVPLCIAYWIYQVFFDSIFKQHQGISPSNMVFFALLLCAVGAQIYRYRHVSSLKERQQTKWVVYGFAIGIIGFVLLIIIGNTLIPASQVQSGIMQTFVADTGFAAFLLLIPISIAVAILRSQLYDIDVVINRTLVYGSLTGILGALYAGLIIGLESLAGLITGQGSQPVALVVSTLVIYALFRPLQRRIQAVIDRRFYRRKYDARKTLAAFNTTLRNEVDLNELRQHLLGVVEETMQPAHVSLWLRQPSHRDTSTTNL